MRENMLIGCEPRQSPCRGSQERRRRPDRDSPVHRRVAGRRRCVHVLPDEHLRETPLTITKAAALIPLSRVAKCPEEYVPQWQIRVVIRVQSVLMVDKMALRALD